MRPLPIGVEDFEEIIQKEYYYVDKTGWIRELLDQRGKVNLFTRPRRFGKTLNLSMLKYYFERPLDQKSRKELFQGLQIMEAGDKYTAEQEQYPVIMLTLKSAKQATFDLAYRKLRETIAAEFYRHEAILASMKNEKRKEKYMALRDETADYSDYTTAIAFLSDCLFECYQKKVIILLDEYDVPLENAYYAGFYEEMIAFIRSIFESALKTNPYLEFAVITGCLRISKESIFTGLNNLEIISILNKNYGEYFGFTENEVQEMLRFYHLEDKMDVMKEWYDGYLFGNQEVYNPWSVINYVKQRSASQEALPMAAWSNTSSNSIVRDLIYHADGDVKREIESLMTGQTIEKVIHEDITYGDIHESKDNLWNFLLFTGYLKVVSVRLEDADWYATMAIPNTEVRSIYNNQIRNWFRDEVKVLDRSVLCSALLDGNVTVLEKELGKYLRKMISYMDNRESFYHGFLLGILSDIEDYRVKSNREAGNGRYDICVRNDDLSCVPVIIELKVADRFKELQSKAEEALAQIIDKKYDEPLNEDGFTEALHYGISFFRKQVCVKMERVELEP